MADAPDVGLIVSVIRGIGDKIVEAGIEGVVSVWGKPSKLTTHIPGRLASSIEEDHPLLTKILSGVEDNYISPGIRREHLSPGQAGKGVDLVGIWAFGVDIDAANPLRAHGNLPTTEVDVLDILAAAAVPPSMIVRSGTGESRHGWWVLTKAQRIDSQADLVRLKRASKRFHESMHARARERGFHLDSTEKLNQWLRLPGSLNHKHDQQPAA